MQSLTRGLQWARLLTEMSQYIPWVTEVLTYRCPSDPGVRAPAYGRTNYAACLGDSYAQPFVDGSFYDLSLSWTDQFAGTNGRAADRGMFFARRQTGFRECLDGLSNTLMYGEIATDLGDNDVRTNPALHEIDGADGLDNNPLSCRN